MFTQALLGEKACGARQASSPSRRKRIVKDTRGNSARFWVVPSTPTRSPLHTLGMCCICGITFTAPARVRIHAIACARYVWPQPALACIRVTLTPFVHSRRVIACTLGVHHSHAHMYTLTPTILCIPTRVSISRLRIEIPCVCVCVCACVRACVCVCVCV